MRLILLVSMMLMISSCTSVTPAGEPGLGNKSDETGSGQGWWYASFRFAWPEGSRPQWYRDVMVAHRVIAPVLDEFHGQIKLWRIHRRAGRDGAGHRFSFIFYSEADTARQIYDTIEADPDLTLFRDIGMVTQVQFDDPSIIRRPNLQDTSDPAWPKSIQKNWPWYIQGVSEMWLALVNDLAQKFTNDSLEAEGYLMVQKSLNHLWAHNARHAFLHHLNAVYAYQPFMTQY